MKTQPIHRVPVRFALAGKTYIENAARRFEAPLNNFARCALLGYAYALGQARSQNATFHEQCSDPGGGEPLLFLPAPGRVHECPDDVPTRVDRGKAALAWEGAADSKAALSFFSAAAGAHAAVAAGMALEPGSGLGIDLPTAAGVRAPGAAGRGGKGGQVSVEFKLRHAEYVQLQEICRPQQDSAGKVTDRGMTHSEALRAALRFFALIVAACLTRGSRIIVTDKLVQNGLFLDAARLATLRDDSLRPGLLRLPKMEPAPDEAPVPDPADAFEEIRAFVGKYDECAVSDPSFQEEVRLIAERWTRVVSQRPLPLGLLDTHTGDIKLEGEHLCHLLGNPVCLLRYTPVCALDKTERSVLVDCSAYLSFCQQMAGGRWRPLLEASPLHRLLRPRDSEGQPLASSPPVPTCPCCGCQPRSRELQHA